jgi:hypothetical protein
VGGGGALEDGDAEQHHAVLVRVHAVPLVGDRAERVRPELDRPLAGDHPHPTADDEQTGGAGALVLAELRTGEQREHRLAQPVDRVRQRACSPPGGVAVGSYQPTRDSAGRLVVGAPLGEGEPGEGEEPLDGLLDGVVPGRRAVG